MLLLKWYPDQTDGIYTLFRTKMAKSIPYFRLEMLENDTLLGGTYLYGLYMGGGYETTLIGALKKINMERDLNGGKLLINDCVGHVVQDPTDTEGRLQSCLKPWPNGTPNSNQLEPSSELRCSWDGIVWPPRGSSRLGLDRVGLNLIKLKFLPNSSQVFHRVWPPRPTQANARKVVLLFI